MIESIFELRTSFLLEDFNDFYNKLYLYYTEFKKNPKNENINELKKLSEIINKSSKISEQQKKLVQRLIDDIYIIMLNKNNIFKHTKLTSEESDLLRRILEDEIKIPESRIEKMNFVVIYNMFKYQTDRSRIFTFDKNSSVVFEQAYGINFDGKCYHLDIYLPDVITFLDNNRTVLEKAYERGETLYTNKGRYDMIPYPNIIEHLSFKTNSNRNAVKFSFTFNKNGKMISYDINPVYIKIDKHIEEGNALKIINDGKDKDGFILLLQELIKKYNTELNNHRLLNPNKTQDLISFPSVYLNHFISSKCDKLIFFDGKKYTSNKTNYASISTPIRKIVSDINLALFLNHIGYFRLSDKDFGAYIDHRKEIIDHLNERRQLAAFIKKYPNFLDKNN